MRTSRASRLCSASTSWKRSASLRYDSTSSGASSSIVSSDRSRRCVVGRTTIRPKDRRLDAASNPPGEGTRSRVDAFGSPEKGQAPPGGAQPRNSVAPVEVAGAIDLPETGILDLACGHVLGGLLTGPGQRHRRLGAMCDEVRLDAVHRLLEAGLFLGLEERVVLERIVGFVAIDRHLVI